MDDQPDARRDFDAANAAIAVWIMKYRYAAGLRGDKMKCTPEDVAQLARELGIKPAEMAALANKGLQSTALLEKMLHALGVEPGRLANANPLIMQDLTRLCITCVAKGNCERDLAAGTAADNFRDYCPNAYTLDKLIKGR